MLNITYKNLKKNGTNVSYSAMHIYVEKLKDNSHKTLTTTDDDMCCNDDDDDV